MFKLTIASYPLPVIPPLPSPSQLDKWTRFDVFRYFKSKAAALSIPDKELNIFVEERITFNRNHC
jgi:hypothetical protein